jgi:ACS family hexuronate transporter-like MFS transporter
MSEASTPVPPAANQGAQSGSRGNFRWMICGLLFFSVAVNYIDRLVIGILKGPLSEKLGWSEIDYGYITAAFNFAYAFGYLFGGRVMDRFGVKRGLPLFVLMWSAAAMAHGLCGQIGVEEQFKIHYPWFSHAEMGFVLLTLSMPMTAAGFAFARIALGLSEGGNFPGAIRTVAEWFPVKERALATGWFNAGTNVGAILCPLVAMWVFKHFGWQTTFYATGATGCVWVVAWRLLYDSPEKHRRLSPNELAYIKSGQRPVEKKPANVPWFSLLGRRPVWAYLLASALASPAWTFYQSFISDFFKKRFHLSLTATAWWTSAFFALATIGGVAGGWLAGRLIGRGWSLNHARKIALLVCALAVVPVFLAPFTETVWLTVVIVGLAGSAHQGWSANLFSFVSDTMPRETISSVIGLGGFLTYFTGGLVSGITGHYVQRTGNYVWVFAYFSGMYVLSLIAIQLFVPRIAPGTSAESEPAPC